MRIIVPTTKKIDIGPLDATIRLPMAGRLARGQKTICDACGKPVKDEIFIGGFKAGRKNMIFHEACVPEGEPKPSNG